MGYHSKVKNDYIKINVTLQERFILKKNQNQI